MYDSASPENSDTQFDSVAFGRAVQRAALDLEQIVVLLARTHPALRHGKQHGFHVPLTWRALLDIDEQAFADLGFQGRHPAAVRDALVRLAGSRIVDADHDMPVDWQRDEDPVPAVYAIVRALAQESSTEIA